MDILSQQDIARQIMEKVKEIQKNMVELNVMVLGKTGVGKSTLINNVFHESLAETGIGKPVTDLIREYKKEGFPLAIYDTPGLELGGENAADNLLKEAIGLINKGIESGDIGKAIHCIWYCVSTTSHRFEEAEKSFITRLLSETGKLKVPVILVMTQSYSKKDTEILKAEIEKENLPVVQIIPVLADDFEINDEYVAKKFGLDRLIDVMNSVIPDTVRNTLIAVQKASLSIKQKKAQIIVATSAATAAATGAVPIPFSDAVLLVPEQIAMLAGITAVFGLPIEKSTLISIISATIGTAGTTVLGKSVVTSLFKLIPGVGSVVGGAIAGSVAAAITAALGESYIGVMMLVSKGEMKMSDLDTPKGRKKLTGLFKDRLKKKRDEKGDPIS